MARHGEPMGASCSATRERSRFPQRPVAVLRDKHVGRAVERKADEQRKKEELDKQLADQLKAQEELLQQLLKPEEQSDPEAERAASSPRCEVRGKVSP